MERNPDRTIPSIRTSRLEHHARDDLPARCARLVLPPHGQQRSEAETHVIHLAEGGGAGRGLATRANHTRELLANCLRIGLYFAASGGRCIGFL